MMIVLIDELGAIVRSYLLDVCVKMITYKVKEIR